MMPSNLRATAFVFLERSFHSRARRRSTANQRPQCHCCYQKCCWVCEKPRRKRRRHRVCSISLGVGRICLGEWLGWALGSESLVSDLIADLKVFES
ncbi:hypothetical protein VNO80_06975 [Phaseolus coccineus]|uniref:Uncharacterized protein n=1 Tax=Phaseolus coccineus TaxID=3886 RepID=A0AAN9NHU9_PHACN